MDGINARVAHYGDYVVSHTLHICFSFIVLVAMPLWTISVVDPVLEAHESATQSYQVE